MKAKILALVLTSILFVSFVIAINVNVPGSVSLSDSRQSATFTISNPETTKDAVLNLQAPITIEDGFGNSITVNLNQSLSTFSLVAGSSVTLNASLSSIPADFGLGTFTKTASINVSDALNPLDSQIKQITFSFANSYCDSGEVGDLEIKSVDFSNKEGFGEDDEWYMLDEIEVEVEVKNRGNQDVDDVVVEWGLYNKKTGDFVIDEEEDNFDINDDEEETVTFTFTVDPDDFDENDDEDDFIFYVKAFSDDEGESKQCSSNTETVKIVRDSDFVVLKDITFPEVAQCGAIVEGTAEIWNIGDEDQDDVYVTVVNRNLGLNERVEFGDLDVLEDGNLRFDFTVPQNVRAGNYPIQLNVFDEDDDIFENGNDDEARFFKNLRVEGNCVAEIPESTVDITASLDSDAIKGKEMVVKTIFKNTGLNETTYQVTVSGYSDWANLSSVIPQSLTIAPGDSKETVITLVPIESGNQEFTIQAVYNGVATDQKVRVSVEAEEVGRFGRITGSAIVDNIKNNWFIWVIAALNIILVIVIIVVAVRIMRK